MIVRFPFDNTYARQPERFFARVVPTPVSAPRLIRVNAPLATQLGLDPVWLARAEQVAVLAGNRVPEMAELQHQTGKRHNMEVPPRFQASVHRRAPSGGISPTRTVM